MKILLVLICCLVACHIGFAQYDSVPKYLTRQNFPDSVRSWGVQALDGKKLTIGELFDSYKGRKVLIDIWGSWCRDCLIGYPKLEALRREVGEKNVAYLFLSTDKEVTKWKAAIEKFSIRGDHYLLDGAWQTPLSNYIRLDWVPRYLVLDEKGRVIMPKAIVADDENLKQVLSNRTH